MTRARRSPAGAHPGSATVAPSAASRPAAPIAHHAFVIALVVCTAWAAYLRLHALTAYPPGLDADEAIGAWIARCLSVTGHDPQGVAWPVFYTRGIGDFPTMLGFYVLIPFQRALGMSVMSTRLPGALAGTLAVPLIAAVGARVFGRRAGLLAAALLAADPWGVFLSRFGVGASLCVFQMLLVLALLLAAGAPVADAPPGGERTPRARWWLALLAGLAGGLACYGFHPMRLWVPALALGLLVLHAPRVRREWHAQRASLIALTLALAATAGPLLWSQLRDPNGLARWQMTRLWEPGASLARIAALVGQRYAMHFGPRALFVVGDPYSVTNPGLTGPFSWWLLPLLVAGLIFAVRRARGSASARTLLLLVAIGPIGDIVSRYDGMHALRDAPALAAWLLLAAYGAVSLSSALAPRLGRLATALVAVPLLAAGARDAAQLARVSSTSSQLSEIYHGYSVDLLQAVPAIRSALAQRHDVYVTTTGDAQPLYVLLVALDYDPRQWFRDAHMTRAGAYDEALLAGHLHFLYGDAWQARLDSLRANGKPDSLLLVVRAGEYPTDSTAVAIHSPDGRDVLRIARVIW